MDVSLRKHGVVFEFGLPQRWGVASNDNELCLAGSQGLEGGLVAEHNLTALHDESKARVDALRGFLRLLGRGCIANEDVLISIFVDISEGQQS